MNLVTTLLLLVAVLGLLLIPLVPSLREIRVRRDAAAIAVDGLARQDTRHFALSFRHRIEDEAHDLLDPARASGRIYHGEFVNGESYVIIPGLRPYEPHPDESDGWAVDRMLLSAAELSLPDALELRRECYSAGDLRVGRDCLLRAAYAEGDAVLQDGASVQRWIHAEGDLRVGTDCALYGRASAEGSISFEGPGGFERLRAPLIEVGARELHDSWRPPRADLRDFDLQRLPVRAERQGQRTTVHGDLEIPEGSVVHGDLVVRGRLIVGQDVRIQGNVKVYGDTNFDAGVVVAGALTSLADVELGPGCRLRGPLLVEHALRVGRRCQLGDAVTLTTVRARRISLADGVRAHGTLWATERGRVG